MNRTEFLDIIKNDGSPSGIDLSGLDELVKLYPWFQSAYSVILNDLFRSGSFKFESNLKESAIYIADREVLYYLLNGATLSQDTIYKDSPGETQEAKIDGDSIEESPKEKPDQLEDNQSGRTREELLEEINKRLSEIDEKRREETILILEDGEISSGNSDENEEVVSFTGFDTELLDMDYPSENSSGEEKASDMTDPVNAESDLVDRFLEKNPRIEAKADTSVNELEDITRDIEDRSEGLVSETLAGIYLNQKYYTKAILIYEKLSLKYPEKSSYFAAQIEKIRELIS